MFVRCTPPVLAASFFVAFMQCADAQAPQQGPRVTVALPVVKDIVEQDEFIGRFQAIDEVDIRSRVSGYLEKVHFVDGSLIKTGDLLFTIDQRPYQNALAQAEAAVTSSQVRLNFAKNDLERAEQLRLTGNIADQVLDQRRQIYLVAKAELDRAEGALRQARLDLEFTEIRSPLPGRISRKLVSVGNLINANETILTNVVALDPIHFYFDVDERSFLAYSHQLQGGTRTSVEGVKNEVVLRLTTEKEGNRVGELDFVDNRLDPASGTIRARARFPNKDLYLVPGLFGRVTVGGSDPHRGVLIPDEAVGSDQDRRIVYVLNTDNTVTAKPVRTGPRIDGYRVIRSGLTGDEIIVVNGLMRLRPGVVVSPSKIELPRVRERNGT